MKSIRVFLLLVVVAIVTLANFAAAVRGYLNSMEEAQRLFDQRMYQHIDLLNYLLPEPPANNSTQVLELPSSINRSDSSLGLQSLEFQWIDNQGRMLARSAGMPASQVAPLEEGSRFVNFHHYRWHLLVARSADRQSWYLLAERDDQRYRMAEAIILQAVIPMVAALPLVALMIWWVIGVGLRPLRSLAAQLREREATDLRPLVLADMPQELLPLAHSANELLRRLESSFAREKRFSADAAHELRTPIAALRIHCDNLLKELQPTPASLHKLQVGIERMSYLVEQILLLNRTAPDHFMGQFAPVNFTALVKQAVVHASHALVEKNLELEVQGDDCWIRGDAAALDSLVSNLLANAIKYTPAGGQLWLGCWRRGEQVVLEVMDSGPGIPPSEYSRVFDRFYRVAGDRHTSQVPGCGLGLAIVKQVVDLHQAHIQLSQGRHGRGLLVLVTFQALDQPLLLLEQPRPPSTQGVSE